MNNLTTREKAMAFGILLILVIFLVYFFGIRILNDNYKQYQQDLKTLQDKKKFLDELKEENANTEEEIKLLNANIEKIELSFIDKLETENIEQYLFDVFEKNNCPYMSNVDVEDITMTPIVLADGSSSENAVLRRSIKITYVTTDGFLPATYNGDPSFWNEDGTPNEQLLKDLIKYVEDRFARAKADKKAETDPNAAPGDPETEIVYFEGYDGFIDSLKQIAAENKDCIKVTGIEAESTHGYLKLTATVDFFGATFSNRVSVDNNKAAYTWWCGNTNIDTKGGFIGRPYYVKNPDSKWNHTAAYGKDVIGFFDRPFTHYVINAYFSKVLMDLNSMDPVTGGAATINGQNQDAANNPDDFQQVSND
ncbi:MAG: hypothetical protein J6X33_10020 [Clostridiales bacterium]|nr:hypothetical protein [Clostridiales bacterium]